MKTMAAILVKPGTPLVIAPIEIPKLKSGQVLVEVAFSGVCHTQVLECRGHRGEDPYLPHCLGHEGSGIVCEIGPGVTKVKPGDRVILSWIKGSGADVPGSVYDWNGRSVNAGAITTFSRFSVVSENRVTRLPDGIGLNVAALLGCAVPTGLGAVLNTARPEPGQSLAVWGVGGVGLCAVAGGVMARCSPIVALDVSEAKLSVAARMGATHAVLVARADPLKELQRICPGGLDFAVEAAGRVDVMRQALESVRKQGGIAVVVGNARHGERLEIDPRQLNMGKQLRGTWGGDCRPDRDYLRYAQAIRVGTLDLSPLLSPTYRLSDVDGALLALETGKVIRPLLDLSAG